MSDYQQPPPINPYDSPETVRPGMSGGTKVLLGLGIGCGVLVLLCCGVFGIGGYFFGRSVQHAMSEDPATIRNVTDSIVTIEIPPPLEPKMSLDWTMPILDRKVMTMAIYGDKQDHSGLVLFQLAEDLGDREAMDMQFRNSLRQSGRSQWKEVELKASETFKTEINGSPAEFTLGVGKDEKSGREVAQATGTFSGKGGPAMLFLQVNAKDFTKDQVMEILKSMK
ncbi:MAG: hypothetical protein WDZ48_10005 [Pirellulales bacterium]